MLCPSVDSLLAQCQESVTEINVALKRIRKIGYMFHLYVCVCVNVCVLPFLCFSLCQQLAKARRTHTHIHAHMQWLLLSQINKQTHELPHTAVNGLVCVCVRVCGCVFVCVCAGRFVA